MPHSVNTSSAEHYVWGGVSDGWRLLDRDDLSVIEERVPAGGKEDWHTHVHARQFFYVLEGTAVMRTDTGDVVLEARSGVEVPPGIGHQFTNPGPDEVRFLVVSSPNSRGDRV
jgi:mannose-6-phosphate isomerase-like protein (cupin superfamily)